MRSPGHIHGVLCGGSRNPTEERPPRVREDSMRAIDRHLLVPWLLNKIANTYNARQVMMNRADTRADRCCAEFKDLRVSHTIYNDERSLRPSSSFIVSVDHHSRRYYKMYCYALIITNRRECMQNDNLFYKARNGILIHEDP
uniref:Uncharacterized protein n=1 Tax=Trichogramma kaykai TaxID=54128 RepID=A0ABD2WE67_9HYME